MEQFEKQFLFTENGNIKLQVSLRSILLLSISIISHLNFDCSHISLSLTVSN